MRAQITLELDWFDEDASPEQIAHKIRDLVTEHTISDVAWWEGQEMVLIHHERTELGHTWFEPEWVVKHPFANEAS